MKLAGTNQLHASRRIVFACLLEPEVLERCIPGCERLAKTGQHTYATTIRAGVGTVKGVFNGTVRLEDIRAPEHYRLILEGKGQPGFMNGSANLELNEVEGVTVITYAGELEVGGTIASVGHRMIQGTAKMMATQFFLTLEAEAKLRDDDGAPKTGFFRSIVNWVRRAKI